MTNTNRPRRDVQYDPPRATLADKEAREFGIEPLDAATAPRYAALGRERAIAAAVEAERVIVRQRISSVLDVDLSGVPMQDAERSSREHEGMGARETMNSVRRVLGMPTLPEDAFAAAMFDDVTPPTEEPSISIGELIEERDEAIAALDRAIDELRVARAENDALRKHLNAALDRARDLEASK